MILLSVSGATLEPRGAFEWWLTSFTLSNLDDKLKEPLNKSEVTH